MLVRYVCTGCNANVQRLVSTYEGYVEKPCTVCGAELRRKPVGPSSQVVERLDNGAMPRAVERLADAERLYKDRSDNSDPLSGGIQHLNRPKTG